ncbi:alpha/beta hydrolase [Plantactinospora sp. WMMC1484]|uniref:alpha/beta hydrolase n=1 Tax=Plantactinospora sp. WMMC1484 TaxID=3404122 RepID=UPI003BF468DA
MTEREERYVEVPGGWCYTVLDRPVAAPRAIVVCAHGLTGDRSGPAELLADWAVGLSATGAAVLRFDFRGSGESSGSWLDTTFAGMTSDLVAIGEWARASIGAVPLVTAGISIGGVPAALAAPDLDAAGTLLMSSDLIEDVRFEVAESMPIRGGEFHLPHGFFRERERLRPRSTLAARGRPWGLVYGARDDKLRRAATELAALGAWVREIADTDHLFGSVGARDSLLEHSTGFVADLLGAAHAARE